MDKDGQLQSVSRVDSYIYWLGIGKRFIKASFENYRGPAAKKIAEFVALKPVPWIYMYGVAGCGKTHLTAAIVRALFESGRIGPDTKRNLKYANVPELLFEIKHTYSERFCEDEMQKIKRFQDADVLILDDIGTERVNDWSVEIIYRIINYRWRECACTIVTSNFSPTELEKMHGAPIVSRLCSGEIVNIESGDYRKKRT
jgi:DNA replication protein DnaC